MAYPFDISLKLYEHILASFLGLSNAFDFTRSYELSSEGNINDTEGSSYFTEVFT
jgi:hypothetical protein